MLQQTAATVERAVDFPVSLQTFVWPWRSLEGLQWWVRLALPCEWRSAAWRRRPLRGGRPRCKNYMCAVLASLASGARRSGRTACVVHGRNGFGRGGARGSAIAGERQLWTDF
eukprot:scaffold15482_cov52-Phaeocystis_antarctica.AAC.1